MLKGMPKVDQVVEVLETGTWSDTGERYQTEGDIHFIAGHSDVSGAAYFIGDLNEPVYIDEASFHMYKLIEATILSHEEDDVVLRISLSQLATVVCGISAIDFEDTNNFLLDRGLEVTTKEEDLSFFLNLNDSLKDLVALKEKEKEDTQKEKQSQREEHFNTSLEEWLDEIGKAAQDKVQSIQKSFEEGKSGDVFDLSGMLDFIELFKKKL